MAAHRIYGMAVGCVSRNAAMAERCIGTSHNWLRTRFCAESRPAWFRKLV